MSTPPVNSIDLSALSSPAPDVNAIDLSSLDITNNATLSFTVVGTGYWENDGVGSVQLNLEVTGAGFSGSDAAGEASLGLSASGSGFQDWVSVLPPVQLQEVYRLVITGSADGLDDLYIGGISSWQATNQAGGRSSYLQAVIPAANQVLADIEARQNGQLVIQKGYRLEGGEIRYEEVLRSRFDTLRPDRGQLALTVTVSGYLRRDNAFGGQRTLTGIRSISAPNGKRRVRCDVDLFLQPGMTVEALGETFRADYINYYVSDADKFCEVAER